MSKHKTALHPTLLGLCLGLLFTPPSISANSFDIKVENDEVSVDANNASLKELLAELEKLTGIPVNFVSEPNERVTLTVSMTNVENAISKITPNHMIVHEQRQGKTVIKEVLIIPGDSSIGSSSSAGSSFLPNGQPAPAIEQSTQVTPAAQPEPNPQTDTQLSDQTPSDDSIPASDVN